jgi:hypothetical protein
MPTRIKLPHLLSTNAKNLENTQAFQIEESPSRVRRRPSFRTPEGAELPERQWSAFLPHKMQTAFQKLATSTTAFPQHPGKTGR